jgi:hypothetical protein
VTVEATVEHDQEGWSLTFIEPLVTQLRVDYRFSLLLAGGSTIAIGEPFELADESGVSLVPPGDVVHEVTRALPLFNQRITGCRAVASGELTIRFDGGAVLRVPVNQHYENWEIALSTGEQWIGLPGGGISHFPAP